MTDVQKFKEALEVHVQKHLSLGREVDTKGDGYCPLGTVPGAEHRRPLSTEVQVKSETRFERACFIQGFEGEVWWTQENLCDSSPGTAFYKLGVEYRERFEE